MKMEYDIFISYSRKDTAIADRVCEALDQAGISYFIDRQDIGGGFEFPVVLAEAILNSKLVLFLASQNSYDSKFTNAELTFAFNEKPKNSILPYIIDGSIMPPALRFVFSSINWREIATTPIEPDLIHDLKVLLQANLDNVASNTTIITEPVNGPSENYDPLFGYVVEKAYEAQSPSFAFLMSECYMTMGKAKSTMARMESMGLISREDSEQLKPFHFVAENREELIETLVSLGIYYRFKVGDLYDHDGTTGIVFDIDEDGIRGKIMALNDCQGRWSWYSNDGKIFRVRKFSENDGAVNSDIFTKESNWYKKFPAFATCTDNGPEWYLPSINELKTIYEQRDILSQSCEKHKGEWLQKRWDYWSSFKNQEDKAVSINMLNGAVNYTHEQSNMYLVRPVAKFNY